MSNVDKFFKSTDSTQPMTPEQVREFERAHRRDQEERHGESDRRRLRELLEGR